MERRIQGNEKCSKTDLYRVLESITSPCFELNRELDIIYVNSAFLSVSGLDSNDLVFVKITDLANNSAENFTSALHADGTDSCLIKNAGLTFNGKRFAAGIAITKLYDESGSVAGLLCVLHGITPFCTGESLNRELRKLRAVCIFAGGAAHDYNNALTAVMGNLSLAKLEAEGNQELTELLKDAETASNKIRQLTEKIALFARGIKITKNKTDVSLMIKEVVESASLNYKGECSFLADKDLPSIEIDKELVSEAFLSVIENAFEAAPSEDGKITVTVSKADIKDGKRFSGTSVAEGDYISISVSDNGPGFGSEDIRLLFNPYYTTKEGRDGIGLALSSSILKRHRGFIVASGNDAGGAVFTMYLPLF